MVTLVVDPLVAEARYQEEVEQADQVLYQVLPPVAHPVRLARVCDGYKS